MELVEKTGEESSGETWRGVTGGGETYGGEIVGEERCREVGDNVTFGGKENGCQQIPSKLFLSVTLVRFSNLLIDWSTSFANKLRETETDVFSSSDWMVVEKHLLFFFYKKGKNMTI